MCHQTSSSFPIHLICCHELHFTSKSVKMVKTCFRGQLLLVEDTFFASIYVFMWRMIHLMSDPVNKQHYTCLQIVYTLGSAAKSVICSSAKYCSLKNVLQFWLSYIREVLQFHVFDLIYSLNDIHHRTQSGGDYIGIPC